MQPFDDLVRDHGVVVLRVCRALLGPHEAEDAWSETFLSALRAHPGLRPDSDVRAWLVTIAHRRAIDQLRSRGRAPVPAGAEPGAASVATADGHGTGRPLLDDGPLLVAVRSLPPRQRDAVVLRHLADMSYPQLAGTLGCTQAAARRAVADGIATLRRTVATQEEP